MIPISNDDLLKNIVDSKLRIWLSLHKWNNRIYWGLGGLSVACSTLAAATIVSGKNAPYLAAASAISGALLGFINPQLNSNRFIRAWRYVEGAKLDFLTGNSSVAELVEAVKRGEEMLSEQTTVVRDDVKRQENGNQDS